LLDHLPIPSVNIAALQDTFFSEINHITNFIDAIVTRNNETIVSDKDAVYYIEVLPEPQGPRAALISVSVAFSQMPQPKLQVHGDGAYMSRRVPV